MALATYSDLQTAVCTDWLDRSDLTSKFPVFVSLTEARINRDMRVREMMATVSLTTDSDGKVALPSDFLELKELAAVVNGSNLPLEYVDKSYFDARFPENTTSTGVQVPKVYTIIGGYIYVGTPSTTTHQLTYYQTISGLTSGNPTNWLMSKWPDLYLYGCLTQASIFAQDKPAASDYDQIFTATMESIKTLDRYSRQPTSMRSMGATP